VDQLSQVVRSLRPVRDVDETLDTITAAAVENIPGVDHASVSVINAQGAMETLVPTDAFVAEADLLQIELGEGPCLDAALKIPLVRVDDMAAETRWAKYAPRAAAMGVGSQMAMYLFQERQSLGGLNLYFDQPHAITTDTEDLAEFFAIQAAMAMGHSREVAGLNRALASRQAIGQAIGIVMARDGLDENRAFQFLARLSQTRNVKLRAVANEIIAATNNDADR
jgi:GAF domain-containing protein